MLSWFSEAMVLLLPAKRSVVRNSIMNMYFLRFTKFVVLSFSKDSCFLAVLILFLFNFTIS